MAPGKKRQAGSQAGPKTKKLQLEKTPADKGKKRSQPITRPLQEETLDSSEESDGDEPDEEEVIVEGEAQPAVAKDPNGTHDELCLYRPSSIHEYPKRPGSLTRHKRSYTSNGRRQNRILIPSRKPRAHGGLHIKNRSRRWNARNISTS